jgi:ribonuclease HI
MTIQWVPAHAGVEGNEQADWTAKQVVLKSAPADDEISLAHVTRAGTEAQRERRKQ